MQHKVYKDIHRIYIYRILKLDNERINGELMSKKKIKIMKDVLSLGKDVETFYEKEITKFGNSAKIDAPKAYIGQRAYIIVIKR